MKRAKRVNARVWTDIFNSGGALSSARGVFSACYFASPAGKLLTTATATTSVPVDYARGPGELLSINNRLAIIFHACKSPPHLSHFGDY